MTFTDSLIIDKILPSEYNQEKGGGGRGARQIDLKLTNSIRQIYFVSEKDECELAA